MKRERLVKQVKIKVTHDDPYERKYELRVKRRFVDFFEKDVLPVIEGSFEVEDVKVWKEGFK